MNGCPSSRPLLCLHLQDKLKKGSSSTKLKTRKVKDASKIEELKTKLLILEYEHLKAAVLVTDSVFSLYKESLPYM